MEQIQNSGKEPVWRRWSPQRRLLLVIVLSVVVLGVGGYAWAQSDPDFVPHAVDAVRDVVGPAPVALAESTLAQVEETYNYWHYRLFGSSEMVINQPVLPRAQSTPLSNQPPSRPRPAAANPAATPTSSGGNGHHLALVDPGPDVPRPDIPAPIQPAGPPLQVSSLDPDPARPYAHAAVVKMDLTQLDLHLVAGTVEPKSSVHANRPGMIPASQAQPGIVVAAWDGGFKTISGAYGMMVDGVVLLPPKPNIATVALYDDGSVYIGTWGTEITPTTHLVWWRQNCPILLDGGQINPEIRNNDFARWGNTVKNNIYTWRSGLGLSPDGKTLIYVVGPSLSVENLAVALKTAGAWQGMQLDINQSLMRFDTFSPAITPGRFAVVANKLLPVMNGASTQFLVPYDRDFFYVTTKGH